MNAGVPHPDSLGNPQVIDRFLGKVDRTSQCWYWTAWIDRKGYGRFNVAGKTRRAHQVAYLLFIGQLPGGLQIDHRCHSNDATCPGGNGCLHRRCVNPAHLQAVTPQINTLRGKTIGASNSAKTHCIHGHEFTPDNTYPIPGGGGRACRRCRDDAARRYRARKRGRF